MIKTQLALAFFHNFDLQQENQEYSSVRLQLIKQKQLEEQAIHFFWEKKMRLHFFFENTKIQKKIKKYLIGTL